MGSEPACIFDVILHMHLVSASTQVKTIAKLSALQQLQLEGNPVCLTDNYSSLFPTLLVDVRELCTAIAGTGQTLKQQTLVDDLTTASMDTPQASVHPHTTRQSAIDLIPAAQVQGTEAASTVSLSPTVSASILPEDHKIPASHCESQAHAVSNSTSSSSSCSSYSSTIALGQGAEQLQAQTVNEPSVTFPQQPSARSEPLSVSETPAATAVCGAAATAGFMTCGATTADSAVSAAAVGAVASATAAASAETTSLRPTQDPSTEASIEAMHLQLLIQSLSHSYQQLQQQHTLLQQQHTQLQQQHMQLASESALLKEGTRVSEHQQVCLLAQNAQLSQTTASLQEQNTHLDSQLELLSTQASIEVRF